VLVDFNSERPLFLQIAEGIEAAILSGAIEEEAQIPSTTEISVTLKINPATALKGINLLVDQGIVYKKRGLGMFVAKGAVEALQKKRTSSFYDEYVIRLVEEAKKLHLHKEQIIEMIEKGFER